MILKLHQIEHIRPARLEITGSKSETNRLLLLQALFPSITIENASESDDSHAMRQALAERTTLVDIHHAGTAMRFLTAYFATEDKRSVRLTGSGRMQQRPISILVDALRHLGADIDYVHNEGFPPLDIRGRALTGKTVVVDAGTSSQYISALLLIAARLPEGLELILDGTPTSIPYIKMTLSLLESAGIRTSFQGNRITVAAAQDIGKVALTVESDWSSASYFYALVALSGIGTEIWLSTYKPHSFQGDSALRTIYREFGVETVFDGGWIALRKIAEPTASVLRLQLNDTPDIAQTIAVTAFGLGLACELTGLHTLKIKETDRLAALKTELEKLGAQVSVSSDSLSLGKRSHIVKDVSIDTYDDHRMAMAFAPLALKTGLQINDAGVVTKSFPTFWDDLAKFGFRIETLKP